MKYGISDFKHNPPKRVPWLPEVESRELVREIAHKENEKHRSLNTGRIFKIYEIRETEL